MCLVYGIGFVTFWLSGRIHSHVFLSNHPWRNLGECYIAVLDRTVPRVFERPHQSSLGPMTGKVDDGSAAWLLLMSVIVGCFNWGFGLNAPTPPLLLQFIVLVFLSSSSLDSLLIIWSLSTNSCPALVLRFISCCMDRAKGSISDFRANWSCFMTFRYLKAPTNLSLKASSSIILLPRAQTILLELTRPLQGCECIVGNSSTQVSFQ